MIILTGGAGFIGSVLCHYLNERGIKDIIIVDHLGTEEKWKNLNGLKYAEFIHKDELFEEENATFLNRANMIFHMGACSTTTEKDADYLMKNNWEYSKKLFQLAATNNIPFIYASSAATYGLGEHGYSDQENIEQLRPLNCYGYSKQFFDQWISNQKRFPKKWYGLKFFNVFGPNEYHKGAMKSIVAKAYHQIKETGQVKLFNSYHDDFKDGEQKRDFVYVKDVCAAIMDMAFEKEFENGIYNMGTGEANTFKDFVTYAFEAMGVEPKIEIIDMPEDLRKHYQYFTEADMGKFHNAHGGFKFSSLKESVKDYVQNYLMKENSFITNGSKL